MVDHSVYSDKAAAYAIAFAKTIHAGILLCHGIESPIMSPIPDLLTWPVEELKEQVKVSNVRLENYVEELKEQDEELFPPIDYCTELGSVKQIVDNLLKRDKDIILVMMGLAGKGTLDRFLLGSNTLDVIENTPVPVLLIPKDAAYTPVKRIAYATDLSESDLNTIQQIARLFFTYHPELLLTHISNEPYNPNNPSDEVKNFLNDVTGKINYGNIYYRQVQEEAVTDGIKWIAANGRIDMLAMVHRNNSVFSRIFRGSNTQKVAQWIELPLLVMPENKRIIGW